MAIKWVSNKKVRIIVIAVVAVALVGGGFFAFSRIFGEKETVSANTATVSRGNISKIIEGSGTITPVNQYEVTALVRGEILSEHFQEGDVVEKGDLLYTIDTADLESSIEKANASVEKAQMNYDQSLKSSNELRVTAPVSGVITELNIKKGDNVSSGTKIAQIINSDEMLLEINFHASDAASLYEGQSAQVQLQTTFATVNGTVKSVATGSMLNSLGASVTPVEILVQNPGSIKPGDQATAIVGNAACAEAGAFSYSEEVTVTAKTGGEVTYLNYGKGDRITSGAVITQLSSESADNSLRNSYLSVQDARLSLQELYDTQEDYRITAPISGKVIQKNIKAGEKIDNSNSSTVMAIIADLSSLIFTISVDELDISSIAVGQEVVVTADALENQSFTGHVTYVSIVGSSSNGVTNYPVEVTIDNPEETGLISGMNVNAQIVIDSRENVLTVPVSAIQRGNMVKVKKFASGSAPRQTERQMPQRPEGEMSQRSEGEMPQRPEGAAEGEVPQRGGRQMPASMEAEDGTTLVRVEIGISDGDFVEIISGLSEGDEVVLSAVTTTNQQQMMPGMPGGMPGGGMPGGGMPGGGMPGGGMPAGGMRR